MTNSEQLRRYAAECIRVAQSVSNPTDKATLLQMAKVWIDLAEMAEKMPSQGSPRPPHDSKNSDN